MTTASTSTGNTLFLCFYGDGPLWDNTILVPAYPSGYSYRRPFRYRDKWIQPAILSSIANKDTRTSLYGRDTLLCMRFRTVPKLLPIRKASIVHIDYLPDNHSVYFRMGPLVDYSSVTTLADFCTDIPADKAAEAGGYLIFNSSISLPMLRFADEASEDSAWVKFCDLLAAEKTLPINDKAKRGFFLRIRKPSQSMGASGTEVLYESSQEGRIFGAVLREGQGYEFVSMHRVPSLIGKNIAAPSIPVKYELATDDMELNRLQEDMTGNYQTHTATISARRAMSIWQDLIIAPSQESYPADDGQPIYTAKLTVPVRVQISLWYRFRRNLIWPLLLWAALFSSTLVASKEGPFTTQGILSAILTGLTAALVFVMQEKVKSHSK